MLLRETHVAVTIRVDKTFQDMLADHHVFTREQDETCRWAVGTEVSFAKDCVIEPYVGLYVGNTLCSIGSFTYSHAALPPALRIGRYCSIAGNLRTIGARHPVDTLSSSPVFYDPRMSMAVSAARDFSFDPRREKIPNIYKPAPVIGNDVWVGSDCAINPGVAVGNGAILARSAVVVKSVADYSMSGGNPAVLFKLRFEREVCERLVASRWWRLSLGQLREAPKADPLRFLDWYERYGVEEPDYAPEPFRPWDEVRRLVGA